MNLEEAKKSLLHISDLKIKVTFQHLISTVESLQQEVESYKGISENHTKQIARRCVELVKNEELDEPICDSDEAYNMAIEHSVDAIRKEFNLKGGE